MLLRGINVGGRNTVPMKQLVAILEKLGCRDVRTYIQSGNAVFRSTRDVASTLPSAVSLGIEKHCGCEVRVLLLSWDEFLQAISANPFPDAEPDPTTLHLGFLHAVPSDPDLEKLASLKTATERFRLIDRVFYLHAPDGIGRSRLAAGSERLIGVRMTDRSWRTVCRVRELGEGVSGSPL